MTTEHAANLTNLGSQLLSADSQLAAALRNVKSEDDIQGQNTVLSIRGEISVLRGQISVTEKEAQAADKKIQEDQDASERKEIEKFQQEQHREELSFLEHPDLAVNPTTAARAAATRVDPVTGQPVADPSATSDKSTTIKSTTGSASTST